MKLYAQQGYGPGKKMLKGLSEGFIDGVILSPKDSSYKTLKKNLDEINSNFPSADCLLDPQFYACFLAQTPGARLGKLSSGDYPFYRELIYPQHMSEERIGDDLKAALEFQTKLNLTHAVAPNIYVPHSLNSIEGAYARTYARLTRSVWCEYRDPRPVYATLVLGANALSEYEELSNFLSEITLLTEGNRPDGFYLLIDDKSSIPDAKWIHPEVLAGWMLINFTLKIHGFEVVNGYSDILTPFLCGVGGDAGATGWFGSLQSFSLNRFKPINQPGGNRPTPRYLSCALLNRIRHDRLKNLHNIIKELMNQLSTDHDYLPIFDTSSHNKDKEILQTWQSLQSLNQQFQKGNTIGNLQLCKIWLKNAKEVYDSISALGNVRLEKRSENHHLETLGNGIQLFSERAEIDLSAD